jgi:phospholipid/cholesterol/gamma-HCH transport system substrate-binding protein
MIQQDKSGLEIKVGIFVLVSLALIAGLMVTFGRFGEHLAHSITVTVKFTTADGLLKGATVNLSGAPIGSVKSAPKPLAEGIGVSVELRIRSAAKVREGSRFRIAEVGMLGDRNIEIDPNPDTGQPVIADGSTVDGTVSSGIAGLTDAAKPVLDRLGDVSNNLQSITLKLDRDILTPQASADLKESIAKLRSVLTRTDALLAEAQDGKGTLGRLLKDPKTANDLSAFIANIRQKGILFYSDVSAKDDKEKKDR